jgi:hypothetical protein
MKILKKLSINPEKVIKNDELVNLRGGGYGTENWCYDSGWQILGHIILADACGDEAGLAECKSVWSESMYSTCEPV